MLIADNLPRRIWDLCPSHSSWVIGPSVVGEEKLVQPMVFLAVSLVRIAFPRFIAVSHSFGDALVASCGNFSVGVIAAQPAEGLEAIDALGERRDGVEQREADAVIGVEKREAGVDDTDVFWQLMDWKLSAAKVLTEWR